MNGIFQGDYNGFSFLVEIGYRIGYLNKLIFRKGLQRHCLADIFCCFADIYTLCPGTCYCLKLYLWPWLGLLWNFLFLSFWG